MTKSWSLTRWTSLDEENAPANNRYTRKARKTARRNNKKSTISGNADIANVCQGE